MSWFPDAVFWTEIGGGLLVYAAPAALAGWFVSSVLLKANRKIDEFFGYDERRKG